MLIVYKNPNDEMNLYYGNLLTSLNKLEYITYCDINPIGNIINQEQDWKKSHIQSIGMKDIVCIAESYKAIRENFPEEFLK